MRVPRHAAWFSKPAGVSYAALWDLLDPVVARRGVGLDAEDDPGTDTGVLPVQRGGDWRCPSRSSRWKCRCGRCGRCKVSVSRSQRSHPAHTDSSDRTAQPTMSEPLLRPDISTYLDSLVPPRHPVLAEMEEVARKTDFPIIGPSCGHFCYLLARLIGARQVFELGSGYGYSTAWFARAVKENGGGVVHHVVWDEKLSSRARSTCAGSSWTTSSRFTWVKRSRLSGEQTGPFDLIFNDIDKEGYPASLGVIVDRVRSGGLLITDNLLWSGRILDGADQYRRPPKACAN